MALSHRSRHFKVSWLPEPWKHPLTSKDAKEVFDKVLDGAGVTALLGQILEGRHRLLHQLGVIGLQLT